MTASGKSIALLFHDSTPDEAVSLYQATFCAEVWREWGFDVRVVKGTGTPTGADLVIPQVDLSVRPERFEQFLAAEKLVANMKARDIRKSAYSENRVSPEDAYEGPVIVKSDANYGGTPERNVRAQIPFFPRFAAETRLAWLRISKAARACSLGRLAWTDWLESSDYRVYRSKHELPRGVTQNDDLVVERFRTERDGDRYVLRMYLFCGDGGVCVQFKGDVPVVKVSLPARISVIPTDAGIVAERTRLGLDIGRLDYALVDGEVVLYDANTTPIFGDTADPAVKEEVLRTLCRGIRRWFPGLRIPA